MISRCSRFHLFVDRSTPMYQMFRSFLVTPMSIWCNLSPTTISSIISKFSKSTNGVDPVWCKTYSLLRKAPSVRLFAFVSKKTVRCSTVSPSQQHFKQECFPI
uniref:Uncharacterized protein n=1 Tax=Anopheles atroparvus TaxID=41427 RepID=A0AAG5DPY4_ANOAO